MTDKARSYSTASSGSWVSQLQRSPGVFFRPGETKGFFYRQDHPLSGGLGRVRVRRQKQSLRPLGQEEEIPGLGLPAGSGLRVGRKICIRLFYDVFKIIPEDGIFIGSSETSWSEDRRGRHLRSALKKSPCSARTKLTVEVIKELKDKGVSRVPLVKKELQGSLLPELHQGEGQGQRGDGRRPARPLTGRGEPFEIFFPELDKTG